MVELKNKFQIEVEPGSFLVRKLSYGDLHDTKFSVQSTPVTFYAEVVQAGAVKEPLYIARLSTVGEEDKEPEKEEPKEPDFKAGDIVVVNPNGEYNQVLFLDYFDLYIVGRFDIVARLRKV
jgi:hypothetical protein